MLPGIRNLHFSDAPSMENTGSVCVEDASAGINARAICPGTITKAREHCSARAEEYEMELVLGAE